MKKLRNNRSLKSYPNKIYIPEEISEIAVNGSPTRYLSSMEEFNSMLEAYSTNINPNDFFSLL